MVTEAVGLMPERFVFPPRLSSRLKFSLTDLASALEQLVKGLARV